MATPFDIIRGTDEPLVRTNAHGNSRFNLVVVSIIGGVHRLYCVTYQILPSPLK